MVLEFLSNREGLSFMTCLSQTQLNNCDLPKVSKREERVNFGLSKVSKININFELLKVTKMTHLKIYISPVKEKLETSNLDSR